MGQDQADGLALDYQTFMVGLAMLCANYPPRGSGEASTEALATAWWLVIERERRWLTREVWGAALVATLRSVKDYLPPVGRFLDICKEESRAVVLAQAREREAGQRVLAPPRSGPPTESELAARAAARAKLKGMGLLRVGRIM